MKGSRKDGLPLGLQIGLLCVLGVFVSHVTTIFVLMEERKGAITNAVAEALSATVAPMLAQALADPKQDVELSQGGIRILVSQQASESPPGLPLDESVLNGLVAAFKLTDLRASVRPRSMNTDASLDAKPAFAFSKALNLFQDSNGNAAVVIQTQARLPDGRYVAIDLSGPIPPPFSRSAFVSLSVSIILIAGLGLLLAYQIAKPITQLAEASTRLGLVEDVPIIAPSGPSEVRAASRAFNKMAERLTRLLSQQRHTLWALGHDLRTPVTALKLRLALLESDEDQASFGRAVSEIEHVVEDALFLARASSSIPASVGAKICAWSLATEAIESANLANDAITLTGDQSAEVCVREKEIARALRNLIENAVKHGRAPIEVHIGAATDPFVQIDVLDSGEGWPQAILEAPGEPFRRGDEARSMPGTGLGLAIVKAVAEGHNGQMTLGNRQNGGAFARLALPRFIKPKSADDNAL